LLAGTSRATALPNHADVTVYGERPLDRMPSSGNAADTPPGTSEHGITER